jgi:hypothetical protein
MKLSVNNSVFLILLFCVAPLFVSCFVQSPYFPYVQPPYIPPVWDRFDAINKLDSIKPGISTKDEVVKRLGSPDAQDRSGKFFQYTGWTDITLIFVPLNKESLSYAMCGDFDPLCQSVPLPNDVENFLNSREDMIFYDATHDRQLKLGSSHPGGQRWMVSIRFDENDVVTRVSTSMDDDMPENHTQGIGKEAGAYCPNADLGHADAQLHIGDIHYHGAYGQNVNPVRAWVWYSLAMQGGDAQAAQQLSRITAELSPEQLAEAQRQLAVWQPGQCAKELVPDGSGE